MNSQYPQLPLRTGAIVAALVSSLLFVSASCLAARTQVEPDPGLASAATPAPAPAVLAPSVATPEPWLVYPYRLTTGDASTFRRSVDLLAEGPSVYALWTEDPAGVVTWTTYIASSSDGGATWSDGRAAPVLAAQPVSMALANGVLYGVQHRRPPQDRGLMLLSSADGGSSWSAPRPIAVGPAGYNIYHYAEAVLLAQDDRLYAGWREVHQYTHHLFFSRSADDGQTWSQPWRLNEDVGSAVRCCQALAAGGGVLSAVWQDARYGNSDILLSHSRDDGYTWSTNYRLNDDSGVSTQTLPAIAARGQAVHVAWIDQRVSRQHYYIYYTRSLDGGYTWSPNLNISEVTVASPKSGLQMVENGGTLYVAWQTAYPDRVEMWATRSFDGGATWLPARAIPRSGDPVNMVLAAGAGRAYLSWSQIDDAAWQVFFGAVDIASWQLFAPAMWRTR